MINIFVYSSYLDLEAYDEVVRLASNFPNIFLSSGAKVENNMDFWLSGLLLTDFTFSLFVSHPLTVDYILLLYLCLLMTITSHHSDVYMCVSIYKINLPQPSVIGPVCVPIEL